MFNILSLKDFKLNKTRIALPKDEEKSQYGNLIILNTKDVNGSKAIISNPFINKLSIYNQIYRDMKFIFKVRGKSINKREAKERLVIYNDYKTSLDLKGIVIFNSNQGKNMYYDISRYNELFFEATVKESHSIKYIDYIDLLKGHILNQEFFKYYTTKVMIIDVESWIAPKVDSNKETAFNNPLNLIYFAMKKDIEKFKELGDIEIIITSKTALFRFNPIRCDDKSFSEFKREVNKLEKTLITDEEDVQGRVVQALNDAGQGDIGNDPKITDAIVKASDKPENNEGTEHDKVNSVVSDPEVVDAIKKNVLEPIDIRSTAMSKRDMELREAQKSIKINNSGQSLEDLMNIKASNVLIPVNDVSTKVKTLNTNMTKVRFNNFAQVYNDQLYDKDISSIAYSMNDKSIPVYIRDVKKENTSDSLNAKSTWTFLLEDQARRRHTLKFDVPEFIDGRYMFLNGNKKEFNNQRFLKPLVKTGPDTVQVCTNYNKIFMTRYGENVEAIFEKFKQMVVTDKKRFSYKKGNCSRNNSAYKTTIEYDTIAKSFVEITCKDFKSGKAIMKLVFNQDKLKELCMAEPALKNGYEYAEKNGYLVFGIDLMNKRVITLEPDSQIVIDIPVTAKKKPVKEGVNLWAIQRVKEIDAEIEALRDGKNADRIDALTTEKDRILSMDTVNHAENIDKYLRNDDIKSMEESFEPVLEMSKELDDITTPEELNRITNTFEYGYLDAKGKPVINGDYQDYRTLTPGQVKENHIGVCWDFTSFESYFFHRYLKKTSSYIRLYYIEAGGEQSPTHTWLTYKDKDGNICIFESSWLPYQGITRFKSTKAMIEYYKKEFLKGVVNKNEYIILEYDPPTDFRLTAMEFMDYVYNNSRTVEDHNFKKNIVRESYVPIMESRSINGTILPLKKEDNPSNSTGYDEKQGNYPYGYYVNGKLVGKIRVTHTKGDKFYGLSWFFVNKQFRRHGIGKKLLEFVINKYGSNELLLNVATDNDNAISLYKKYGFKVTYKNDKPEKGDPYLVMTRKGKEVVDESYVPVTEDVNVETDIDDMNSGIVNFVLSNYSDSLDMNEFAKQKSGKRFMYTRCKVMKKNIPLVVFLSYCEGLSTVLRKAKIQYVFSDKRPRLEGFDAVNKGIIQFADGYLVYDKFPLEKSLLMNGLTTIDTKSVEFAEFDDKSVYLDVFDKLYGSRMLSNALDNFYEWMIDVPTKEILSDLNYPTEFVGLLLAGNTLLSDNNYRDEIDMGNWRIRNNELVYAYAYKRIADAYTKYRMTSENKNPVKISIPKDAVLKDIMMSMIVEDVSELSPIVDVEKSHAVTDKGPSGTNLEQAYTQERRSFHPTMSGVMAISTSPDANVGLVRELTLEPNITNARGYVKTQEESDLNDVNLFSAAELCTPLGVTRDDCVRTAMASKQSRPMLPMRVISYGKLL